MREQWHRGEDTIQTCASSPAHRQARSAREGLSVSAGYSSPLLQTNTYLSRTCASFRPPLPLFIDLVLRSVKYQSQ